MPVGFTGLGSEHPDPAQTSLRTTSKARRIPPHLTLLKVLSHNSYQTTRPAQNTGVFGAHLSKTEPTCSAYTEREEEWPTKGGPESSSRTLVYSLG